MTILPPPDDRLSAYLDEELTAAERTEVDRLLSESEEWRAELAEVAEARNALRSARPHDAPPGFWEHLLEPGPAVVVARPWWQRGPVQSVAVAAAVAAALVGAVAVPKESTERARSDTFQTDEEESYLPGDEPNENEADAKARDEADGDEDENVIEKLVDATLGPFGW